MSFELNNNEYNLDRITDNFPRILKERKNIKLSNLKY